MDSNIAVTARCKLAELMSQYSGNLVTADQLCPVASGASGRIIMRHASMIGVYWTAERADNNSFLPAAQSLRRAGLQVPEIFAEWTDGQGCGACLMSNFGNQDLLSYKGSPWAELKPLYQLAFEALLPLYRFTPDWELQVPFDTSYYGWEQQYFAEHLLGTHFKMEQGTIQSILDAGLPLAQYLDALPRVPVHRDCQSQNIMICDDKAWLIDFQGMRLGRLEYDLASLIYDPYMDLSSSQRNELLELSQAMSGQCLDFSIFSACAMQRLMQALGAFANIGHNQARDWYLKQIPAALSALNDIMQLAPASSLAQQLAQQLAPCLNNAKNL